MELTKLQKRLVATMKTCGLDCDTTAGLCTGLVTEEQQWAMLDWMDQVYDRTGAYPDPTSVIRAMGTILDLIPTPEQAADNQDQDSPSA